MSFQPLTSNSKNIQENSHCHPFYHLSALVHGENDHNIVNNFHCVFLKYVYSFGKQNPPRYVFERHNCNNSMWVKNLPYFNQWSANLRCIYVFPDCKELMIIIYISIYHIYRYSVEIFTPNNFSALGMNTVGCRYNVAQHKVSMDIAMAWSTWSFDHTHTIYPYLALMHELGRIAYVSVRSILEQIYRAIMGSSGPVL